MRIMHSTPQPKHEHLTADKTHQEDTPSTATTSHPMALYSKIELDQPTTSITNTFAKINMSPTQSPTQQTDEATTDQPTTKTLPIELWMRVFEYVHADDYARPAVAAAYKRSLTTHGDTIEAAQTLPAFEKRTWKQSRPFYHIDRTSRAAALKLNLCLRMLQDCKAPLHAMQHTKLTISLIAAGVFKNSSPGYMAIQVTEAAEAPEGRVEARAVADMLSGVFDNVVMHSLGLVTAKHVVLLECCNWDTQQMLAIGREIEGAIYESWRRAGTPAGRVEIV